MAEEEVKSGENETVVEKQKDTNNESKEEISAEDFAALEKELNMANDTLISRETAEQIKAAKEETRKEVEKEFLTNQKIKEMEEALKQKDVEKAELEKKTAEQLDLLKNKVNEMASSRAVVKTESPFDSKPPEATQVDISDEEAEEIQKASFHALLERK